MLNLDDAIAKRFWQDEEWRIALRQYEAIPDTTKRNRPYSESVVIEVPLGAKQCDTIVSAMMDLIFTQSPPLTVRGTGGFESHAFAFQLLVDKLLIDPFVNYKNALNEMINDTVQLGTGLGSAIHTEEVVKHAVFESIDRGPRCFSIPPEDFVVPGGAYSDLDSMQFCAYRYYYTETELNEQAEQNGWDITQFKPAGNVDWVRQRREHVAKTSEPIEKLGKIYEVFVVYAYYDYDKDGFAEDLYYIYDRTSRAIGFVGYAPYDSRPFVATRYQVRPHLFYGLGVLAMARQFQIEVSEWHNFKMANAMLANTRFWAYRLGATGLGEELKIGPNKGVGLANPKEDLVAMQMADIYQSAMQYEMQAVMLAEQRVGTNELGGNSIAQGKRVPAATAMALLQQQNRRFAAPFNNVREAAAGLMTMCLLRLQEQYLKGGQFRSDVMAFIVRAVGVKYAEYIEQVFKLGAGSASLRDQITIEVTASTQSINREADKQAAMNLVQILGGYYDKILQLATVMFNPQVPPELKQLAQQVAVASSKAIQRLVRTFDNVRDPDEYIPELFQEKPNEQSISGPTQGAPGSVPGTPPGPAGGGGATEGSAGVGGGPEPTLQDQGPVAGSEAA